MNIPHMNPDLVRMIYTYVLCLINYILNSIGHLLNSIGFLLLFSFSDTLLSFLHISAFSPSHTQRLSDVQTTPLRAPYRLFWHLPRLSLFLCPGVLGGRACFLS